MSLIFMVVKSLFPHLFEHKKKLFILHGNLILKFTRLFDVIE